MKSIQLIVLVLLISISSHAQFIIGTYEGKKQPKRFKLKNEIQTINKQTISKDKIATVLGKLGSNYLIKIDDQEYYVDKKTIKDNKDNLPEKKVEPLVGAFSFPFKYRPQTGIMETNFSLSVVGGPNFRLDPAGDHHLGILLGVGSTSLTLDETNTDPSAGVTESSTRSGVSFTFSFLYKWKELQLAGSIGIDDNLNNKKDKWIYQSKPWMTIGIGFAIFKDKDEE